MAFTVYHIVLITMLLICGSINTLSTKWADTSIACGLEKNCDPETTERKFDHPYVQGVAMFIGEFLCFVVYWIWRCLHPERNSETVNIPPSKWFIFLPPALLDMCGTTTTYIALNLTYPSSYQMLRGAVIVFTGLLSVAFLGRTIRMFMWTGIATLSFGLVIIGIADVVFNPIDVDANGIVSGDLLIIIAQIIVAFQFVYEEKFIKKHNVPPLLVVGLEGMFGAIVLGFLIVPLYYIPASRPFTNNPGHLEDALDAFAQMGQNWHIILATVGCVFSIAVFNFTGISITKELSATTRMVVDSGRTLIVWAVSLAVGWQPFNYRSFLLQLFGFAFLLSGMMIYNDILFRPFLIKNNCLKPTEVVAVNDTENSSTDGERASRGLNDDEPLINA